MPSRDWLRYVAIAGCLAASVAYAQPVSDDARTQEGARNNQAASGNFTEKPSPLALIQNRIAATLEAIYAASESEDEKNRTKRDLAAQESMAFWAMLMFMAAVAQAILSGVGIWVILKTLRLNRGATRAAIKAAEAAEASVAVAEKTAERQLRAYLSIESGIITFPDDRLSFSARVAFKNSGQTPAYEVSNSILVDVWDMPQFEPVYAAVKPVEERDTSGIIGPGVQYNAQTQSKLVKGDYDQLSGRMKRIVVWGEVDYRDIYGKRYTLHLRCAGKPVAGVGWVLQPDKDGNYETAHPAKQTETA